MLLWSSCSPTWFYSTEQSWLPSTFYFVSSVLLLPPSRLPLVPEINNKLNQ
ncbi:hypothetical protein F2Q69_00006752 [Brassica cretica]|uniref:Uncharacterized protein n=1 Tax=Brassica cretica TaxID=69181 RepID=A0A8S9NUR1_BRACR|nr:hypothetical protein F2Q69_00006752 [Brassica cretica]